MFSLCIPTNAEPRRLRQFYHGLAAHTDNPSKIHLMIIDNANSRHTDLSEYVAHFIDAGFDAELIKLESSRSLTALWEMGFKLSKYKWTFQLNDDVIPVKHWDTKAKEILDNNSENIFLFCKPNNWSGWAHNAQFVEDFPFRTEFPGCYYEDDDIYLRVAYKYGLKTKSDVYQGPIYSIPMRDNDCLFQHHHIHDKKVTWQGNNHKVFLKYWEKVGGFHPNAIQNKNQVDHYIAREKK